MTTNTAPLLTIEDLTALPDDDGNVYELIEGELIVSSAPRDTHQEAIGNLFFWVKLYLRDNPIGRVIITPGVIFDRHNSVIPDLVFLTNEQAAHIGPDGHIHEAPALAVEVVSPGRENARRDRVKKLRVYGKFGVGEYWVADPEARTVEIYRPEKGALALAATLSVNDEIKTPLLPGFACAVGEVFGG
ncbi:MAG TPA: Uma2 family endonuclease [Pyrinomonadaceae bacterium]|nr:Uma2 family endonuclease [Pyrinomonadaceae bacterium]